MRLKVEPGDFVVREDLTFDGTSNGDYYIHLLRKEKLDTHQALAQVASLAGVKREDIAFAGLKDRQGRTEQWISIRGRRLDHRSKELTVSYRGRSDDPISSQMSRGNRFEIVVRDLGDREVEDLVASAERIRMQALPNYFDDQRFGCLRHGQGFVMRSLLLGDYEAALHRLIARPSPKAITGDVKLKKILATRWGDWQACAGVARGPIYRRVFQHLISRESDFKGALALMPTRTKLIHAFAYQSYLWNRSVDRMLFAILPPAARVPLDTLAGKILAWHAPRRELMGQLSSLRTPLYGPGGNGGDLEFERATQEILKEQGLREADFKKHAVAGMVLREEARELVVRPRQFRVADPERDDTFRGRRKVSLSFALPRGSYATLVIKRLLAGAPRSGPRSGPRGRGADRVDRRAD